MGYNFSMIIIFGLAGSGKSTQGQILAKKYGWRWLSVGQVIRETGKYEEVTKKGELVDNEVVIGLMNKEIERAESEGVRLILDGYPRDVEQAEYLIGHGFARKITGAIMLEVPRDELWRRIEARGRNDDVKEVIERRFEIFEQNIYTILKKMQQAGVKVMKVNGKGKYTEVTERLSYEIEKMVPEAVERKERFSGSGWENDCW